MISSRRQQHRQVGFSVIEVIIVLAIAGIFFLIVFSAIPVLQRNARNHQRRQDVSVMLSAVSSYELRNSGAFPGQCGGTAPDCADSASNGFLQYSLSKLSYYRDQSGTTAGSNVEAYPVVLGTPLPSPFFPSGLDQVKVANHLLCNPDDPTSPKAGGYYDVVALFNLENSDATAVPQCKQL